jgi:hypothetical protein
MKAVEPDRGEFGAATGRVSAILTRETFNDMLSAGAAASSRTYLEYLEALAEAIANGSEYVCGPDPTTPSSGER